MKYYDSVEASAEYLRLAIPLMARQAAAYHPISYSVWYEYVAGINPALKAGIDRAMQEGVVLDEASTHALYCKHIAEIDEEAAKRVSSGFQRVLADMSHSASQAGDEASRFGEALQQLSDGLRDPGAALGAEVDKLLRDTHQMHSAVSMLKERLTASQHEIERLRQEVSRARQDALVDSMSGLANRKGFDLALAECLAAIEPDSHGPSLLLSDIDFFKQVNDTYGHLFGDKVIRTVAQVLKDNVKGKDVAARYGGEEFAILLPDTAIEGASILAEKLRAVVEHGRIRRGGKDDLAAKITVSFGVTSYRPGESVDSFIKRADKALYASKEQGRNRVTVVGHGA